MTDLVAVVETSSYLHDAERLLSTEEREALVSMLAARPRAGVVVPGTGGLRKLRVGVDGRGKRGGGRVIYWFHSSGYPVVLLAMFAKNEAVDLSPAERKALTGLTKALIEDFGGRRWVERSRS